MKTGFSFFTASVVLAGCLLTTGCATHSQRAGTAVAKLKAGDPAPALRWAEKLKTSRLNKPLGYLESGRTRMLTGDFEGSRQDFETAIDQILETTETGPVIKMSSVAATLAAASVTDDTLRPYELSPYEVIQLLHYQTLNYLFSGNLAGAGVEMRRTVFAQDAIAEKYAKEVRRAQEQSDAAQAKAMETVQSRMAGMGPVLAQTRSSYENGLAWYFCGLLFEMEGDAANASLSYRKAWELAPGNLTIRNDFLRLLRTQDAQAFAELSARYKVEPQALTRNQAGLVVLYEESLISLRHAEKIPLPVPDFRGDFTLIAVDFPFYQDSVWVSYPLALSTERGPLGTTEPAVHLQSLAYRDLKDKMPGIVLRNVTRAAVKVTAHRVAHNRDDESLQTGVMIANLISALVTTADTRAWYTLPMAAQLYRGMIPAGTHTLQCRNPVTGVTLSIPVTVEEGETRLVWITDTGGLAAAATASLTGKGLPPTFQQFSIPSGNRNQ